ncbi:cytochrome c-type biogenesis protein CcmH [Litoreibacter halocynthiae]|uniref:Cytochrome c-type biogenesis protein CcmH n=2 Tax=Litoreibacter halocynthiae TaxID=1242689 RepID=A0A4R7LC53_9RHOB|nr:cytochrome c-type biogenesis protein CcmH [Litoreibacter halocynthiae]
MIWSLFAVLSLVATILMGMPLLRRRQEVLASSNATPAVLLDQLDELNRDLDRGVISAAEAQAAEQELKQRILSEARKPESSKVRSVEDGRVALLLSAILVPVLALSYYAFNGSPEVSGIAFAKRTAERQEAAKIADLTDELSEKLASDPQGGPSEGWMLLGQTYSRMGRFVDAANAFNTVAKRPEANSAVFSMMAEALINEEQGVVTPRAEAAIDSAINLDPANPAAIFYKATALSQRGELRKAHDLLVARLDNADGFHPWMQSFLAEANRIGVEIGKAPLSMASFAPMPTDLGPTGEDIANAQDMTEEDRQAFIRSMVDRLATRLEDEPNDLDGWMRLGNAFSVLGDTSSAVNAFERAETLLLNVPESDQRRSVVANALSGLR